MGFLYPADAHSLASTRVGCGGVLLPLASEEMSRACPLVYSSFIPSVVGCIFWWVDLRKHHSSLVNFQLGPLRRIDYPL